MPSYKRSRKKSNQLIQKLKFRRKSTKGYTVNSDKRLNQKINWKLNQRSTKEEVENK